MKNKTKEKLKNAFDTIFGLMIIFGVYLIWRNILVVVPLVYALAALQTGSEELIRFLPRFMSIWLICNSLLVIGALYFTIPKVIKNYKLMRKKK